MRTHCGRPATLFLLLLAWTASFACGAEERLRAGVFVNPPFVMDKGDGRYEGMAIDLWEEVARELGVGTDYVLFHNVHEMLAAAGTGGVDIVVENLAATHERARTLKFSYPWYDSGLRIMINTEAEGSLWSALRKYKHFRVYLMFILIFLAMAVLMTLIRRRHDPEFPRDWRTGLSLSFYNILDSALNGKLNQRYLGWVGNLFFVAWLLFGVGAVAYFTSSMTTTMAGMELEWDISHPSDLPGKRIGVLDGTVGQDYFSELKTPVRLYGELEDAVADLANQELDAVVMDAPSLEYHAHRNPQLPIEVVGDVFYPDKYCFAAGYAHSGLMDKVTVELIRLQEAGVIDEIRERYFGTSGDSDDEGGDLPWQSEN